jgi:hypothetical protein
MIAHIKPSFRMVELLSLIDKARRIFTSELFFTAPRRRGPGKTLAARRACEKSFGMSGSVSGMNPVRRETSQP